MADLMEALRAAAWDTNGVVEETIVDKSSSWGAAERKIVPASPRDLIGNDARTKAKRWMDAATAVGLLYRMRNLSNPPGQPPEPLWPIAGMGTGDNAIVVYTMREFPMPPYLKIEEWDGFPVEYREAPVR